MAVSHTSVNPRRHDLDALRAFAMLLGIALHGALSFMPMLWPVQDTRQSDAFGMIVAAIHGFRMPVFFVMSGFFTAMLWRRRGLGSVLGHRFRRVFLPLLLGLVTVVPAVDWVVGMAVESAARQRIQVRSTASDDVNRHDPQSGLTPVSIAVVSDQTETVARLLREGADPGARNRDGSTPLAVAALLGRTRAAGLLIRAGADIDARSADGSTPLHTAAFFGRAGTVARLVQAGADTAARNNHGQTPLEVTAADWKTTQFVAALVRVKVDRTAVEAGRSKVVELLRQGGAWRDPGRGGRGVWAAARTLMVRPFFHHLWFLWFLCWLVAGFGVVALLAGRLGWRGPPDRLILTPARFLWLIPLTLIPQLFMGSITPTFGPDTSHGLLPVPHVLAFYAVFFGFGVLYCNREDPAGRVGKRWWLLLPLGLLVLFPLGMEFSLGGSGLRDRIAPAVLHRPISALLQVTYVWVMTFGLMGLFRRLLTRANPAIRYLSDASYWLYLAHLPVIIGAQLLVRDWSMPAAVKFALVCGSVTAILLAVYQTLVRYTWLGRFLNGPRPRPERVEPMRRVRGRRCLAR